MLKNHWYSLIFGTKIQIHNFVIFSKNWIFGHNLRFSYSVLKKYERYLHNCPTSLSNRTLDNLWSLNPVTPGGRSSSLNSLKPKVVTIGNFKIHYITVFTLDGVLMINIRFIFNNLNFRAKNNKNVIMFFCPNFIWYIIWFFAPIKW